MARLVFPGSPSNGDKHEHAGKIFRYLAAKNRWDAVGTTAVSATKAEELETKNVELESSITSLQTQLNDVGGSVEVYANSSILPLNNLEAGQMAYNQANNSLLISNGSGWYSIALINSDPSVTVSINSMSLGQDGNTALFTYTVNDPDGAPVTLTVSNSGISNTSQGNVVHYSTNNTIEVNNFAGEGDEWSGTVTLTVSDGISLGVANVDVQVAYVQPVFFDGSATEYLNFTYNSGVYFTPSIDGNGDFLASWSTRGYQGTRPRYCCAALPYGKYYTEFTINSVNNQYTMFTTTPYSFNNPTALDDRIDSSGWIYNGGYYHRTNQVTSNGYQPDSLDNYGRTYCIAYNSETEHWWMGYRVGSTITWWWGNPASDSSGYNCSVEGTKSTENHFFWWGSGTNSGTGVWKFSQAADISAYAPSGFEPLPLPTTV